MEEKSRIIEFGRKAWQRAKKTGGKVSTFNFVGFTHYCDKARGTSNGLVGYMV